MAVVRKSLGEILSGERSIDRARIEATTDKDVARMIAEDPDTPPDVTALGNPISPQAIRKRLAMTQEEFAKALRIPLATLRSWEQHQVWPDPAARALLTIIAKEPKRALRALAG